MADLGSTCQAAHAIQPHSHLSFLHDIGASGRRCSACQIMALLLHTCPLQYMTGSSMSKQPMYQKRIHCVLQKRTCGPLIGGAEEDEVKGSAQSAAGLPAAHILSAITFVVIKIICLCSLPGTAAAIRVVATIHIHTASDKHCTQLTLGASVHWHANCLPAVSCHRTMWRTLNHDKTLSVSASTQQNVHCFEKLFRT